MAANHHKYTWCYGGISRHPFDTYFYDMIKVKRTTVYFYCCRYVCYQTTQLLVFFCLQMLDLRVDQLTEGCVKLDVTN